ncbi:hypothetical protein POM88_033295 [Heracleum sosnowskyi]|uniref:Translation initiation factor IF- 2 domain-containing protein n=1 Tax=Heracleum sosnowskyi TaxID=360622 RepID=A0AAD8MLF3_9APIA|nr:hypothetical protein POM88_033295 [Heracleum sosnowskyi]
MRVIVKADVQGSVQAVTDALKSLNSSQVFINIVYVGVGSITQSDLDLAQACGACIVGFNVKGPSGCVGMSATQTGIKVQLIVDTPYFYCIVSFTTPETASS